METKYLAIRERDCDECLGIGLIPHRSWSGLFLDTKYTECEKCGGLGTLRDYVPLAEAMAAVLNDIRRGT